VYFYYLVGLRPPPYTNGKTWLPVKRFRVLVVVIMVLLLHLLMLRLHSVFVSVAAFIWSENFGNSNLCHAIFFVDIRLLF
jgi:hypothetical protein